MDLNKKNKITKIIIKISNIKNTKLKNYYITKS